MKELRRLRQQLQQLRDACGSLRQTKDCAILKRLSAKGPLQLYVDKVPGEEGATNYEWIQEPNGTRRPMIAAEKDVAVHCRQTARCYSPTQCFLTVSVGFSFDLDGARLRGLNGHGRPVFSDARGCAEIVTPAIARERRVLRCDMTRVIWLRLMQ